VVAGVVNGSVDGATGVGVPVLTPVNDHGTQSQRGRPLTSLTVHVSAAVLETPFTTVAVITRIPGLER